MQEQEEQGRLWPRGSSIASDFGLAAHELTRKLLELFERQPFLPLKCAAVRLGVSLSTLKRRIKEIGFSLRRFRQCRIEEYCATHSHASQQDVAAHFGISQGTVNYRIRVAGIHWQRRGTGWLLRAVSLLLLIHPQMRIKEVARRLGVSRSDVLVTLSADGFPGSWSRSVVRKTLDACILHGIELNPAWLKRGTYLGRAFFRFAMFATYPLFYRRFHPWLYALFGMEIPQTADEERWLPWPSDAELKQRLRKLQMRYHPDRHVLTQEDPLVARQKLEWLKRGYEILLHRKRWIDRLNGEIGELPNETPERRFGGILPSS